LILEQDFEDFVELLNKYKVEYMVVGGYALAFHGKPRSTGDLDIWINISDTNALKMLAVVKDFGIASMEFKKKDFLKPGYVTQIGYPPLRIDILNSIDGVDFNTAVENMQQIELDNNLLIKYIGFGDFIKNKQASGRKQDLVDIKEIKKASLSGKTGRKKKNKPS
jgi:predicted nucleotidyltransferase